MNTMASDPCFLTWDEGPQAGVSRNHVKLVGDRVKNLPELRRLFENFRRQPVGAVQQEKNYLPIEAAHSKYPFAMRRQAGMINAVRTEVMKFGTLNLNFIYASFPGV